MEGRQLLLCWGSAVRRRGLWATGTQRRAACRTHACRRLGSAHVLPERHACAMRAPTVQSSITTQHGLTNTNAPVRATRPPTGQALRGRRRGHCAHHGAGPQGGRGLHAHPRAAVQGQVGAGRGSKGCSRGRRGHYKGGACGAGVPGAHLGGAQRGARVWGLRRGAPLERWPAVGSQRRGEQPRGRAQGRRPLQLAPRVPALHARRPGRSKQCCAWRASRPQRRALSAVCGVCTYGVKHGLSDRRPRVRYDVPLVADIHFQPAVAMMVAEAFEKVRRARAHTLAGRTQARRRRRPASDPSAVRQRPRRLFSPLRLLTPPPLLPSPRPPSPPPDPHQPRQLCRRPQDV